MNGKHASAHADASEASLRALHGQHPVDVDLVCRALPYRAQVVFASSAQFS